MYSYGPYHFKKIWVKLEIIIGIEPDIRIRITLPLSCEYFRNFWKLLKKIINGNQFNKPRSVKYLSLDILLIEVESAKLTKLLKVIKIPPIKNKIVYLSSKKLSESLLILIKKEISNDAIPNIKAEGKRNNPI